MDLVQLKKHSLTRAPDASSSRNIPPEEEWLMRVLWSRAPGENADAEGLRGSAGGNA